MDNIFVLHRELVDKSYRHGHYYAFKVNDPKPRDIHKASVRDRLLHHAICRVLYPYFDRTFIHDSYSCRIGKGTHRAMNRFRDFGRKVSRNGTRTAWVLKCDIKKFFANIDHRILQNILEQRIEDTDALWLLRQVIDGFCTKDGPGVGLPLGNLTSQLFVNVYMNEFDWFMKRTLRVQKYVRYSDDFVILHERRSVLENCIPRIAAYLDGQLRLTLHPDKLSIKTLASGVDFLGWVHFSRHRVLRTSTKRRMFRKVAGRRKAETVASYVGLLSHGNAYGLAQRIRNIKKGLGGKDGHLVEPAKRA